MGAKAKRHVTDLVAKALDISTLLGYQSDAVVSREIIKKDAGTVTLFAFDKGQGLSEHTAPFDALVYVVDGAAEVIISGKPNKINKGDMIILPANKPHALKAIKQFKMLLVMIKK
ncbi:MAG TPA: cupin domain-containing protein [Candidatus Omnitrophota bacterium]|nr:cupin domain-containing protein [Candidatus Omnitrophota bacterium]